jgi:2-iminobutanoate/2-iminopropanoate deaminase
MRAISSAQAPAAIGPYSQAVRTGDLVFCSGQIPLDPATGALVEGDIGKQTDRIMKNLQAVLEAAGAGLDGVVRTTIYLVDMHDFAAVNEAYAKWFTDVPPARATVQVSALPKGARVEIDAIATTTAR